MIKILRTQEQINKSIRFLKAKNLPLHRDRSKNWDLAQLYLIVEGRHRNAPVLDVGCWMLSTLKLFNAMDFTRLWGIDRYDSEMRFKQDHKENIGRIFRGKFEENSFRSGMFRILTCISTIEHGIDLDKFFSQCKRLLKEKGILYLTTDYWSKKIKTAELDGLPWNIFDRGELRRLIEIAESHKFSLYNDTDIPKVGSPVINVRGLNYTFAMLVFVKK